jgi:alpha-L-fucosidase
MVNYSKPLRLNTLLALLALFLTQACSQTGKPTDPVSNNEVYLPRETPEQYNQRMKWYQDAKFGVFIHWGPGALTGKELSWCRKGKRAGLPDDYNPGTVPSEIYDSLYKEFNPVKFDAEKWVKIIKDAGMKYIVFTTKHHDGFCNFDTKYTDYKITGPNCPFKRDIVAELAAACHKNGIRLGFYYSRPDWHNPYAFTDDHYKFVDYTHNQIRELLSNYGKVDIIWLDGGYPSYIVDDPGFFNEAKKLQPQIIFYDRVDEMTCDYDLAENFIFPFRVYRPWECADFIGHSWSWKADEEIKSLDQCITLLINVVGRGGNLLFGVGPHPDGRILPDQAARLAEIGDWLKSNGESIYCTRGGPFIPRDWGVSTHKDKKIFLHVQNWNNATSIDLPAINPKIVKASLISGETVGFSQNLNAITITVDKKYQKPVDTIIVLELDSNSDTIHPL